MEDRELVLSIIPNAMCVFAKNKYWIVNTKVRSLPIWMAPALTRSLSWQEAGRILIAHIHSQLEN
jgi:hypothetical protein